MKTAGERDFLGVHVRPSVKALEKLGWDGVEELAEFIIPNLRDFPDVEEIRANSSKAVFSAVGTSLGKFLIAPYSNECGKTIIVLFEWEMSRRTASDGPHRILDRR